MATTEPGPARPTSPQQDMAQQDPGAGIEGLEARTLLSVDVISTVAGDDNSGYNGDGKPATAAELYGPHGVAVDAAGDIFIADSANNRIREVVESSGAAADYNVAIGDIITVAGDGKPGYKGDNGFANQAELDQPSGVAVDAAGDLFIADSENNVIREVIESSGAAAAYGVAIGDIITVAGDNAASATGGYSGDGGPATKAEFRDPNGVAVDAAGDLFIADEQNQVIREVVESSSAAAAYHVAIGDIITVAGVTSPGFIGGYSGDGGPATKAELDFPADLAVDNAGDLFIADRFNDRIREVVESSGAAAALGVAVGDIVTVAGDGTPGYQGYDGPARKAELSNPTGVTLDAAGDLFIADEGNDVVREVVESSSAAVALGVAVGDIVTVAGDGDPGYAGDGGPANVASLLSPTSVAVDEGVLFIADTSNERIREVAPGPDTTETAVTSSVDPSQFGSPITFTATVIDTSTPVTTPSGTVQFVVDGNDYAHPWRWSPDRPASLTRPHSPLARTRSGPSTLRGAPTSRPARRPPSTRRSPAAR